MNTAHFPSYDDCEVIEVEFITVAGQSRRRKLLVDSGFTGESSLILDEGEAELIVAVADSAPTSGALRGDQNRGWVTCRIPAIGFEQTAIAILTDLGPLALPAGVRGMAGLSFLRLFAGWGAEQTAQGWQFFVSVE
jgi:hypothetical protein